MIDPLVELVTSDPFKIGWVAGIFTGLAIFAIDDVAHLYREWREKKWNGS